MGEQSRYRDRVVYQDQTAYQRIVITEWKGYHWLHLNGNVQFSTYDEERYHESLVHPAMKLSRSRNNILILGGGDGLAVREVVKYADVKAITLVDLDKAIIDLARTHPVFVEANARALDDPRVNVVIGDAGAFFGAFRCVIQHHHHRLARPQRTRPRQIVFAGILSPVRASLNTRRRTGNPGVESSQRAPCFSVH